MCMFANRKYVCKSRLDYVLVVEFQMTLDKSAKPKKQLKFSFLSMRSHSL